MERQIYAGWSGDGFRQLDMSGVVNLAAFNGTVSYTTRVPFAGEGRVSDYTQGVLRIAGAQGTVIRVAVIDGATDLRVSVDTDGDGEFDYFPEWDWDDIKYADTIY